MERAGVQVYRESGLDFRFDSDQLFKPDDVPGKGMQGVKGCDFIWRRNGTIEVIEVKSSAPVVGDEKNLREYIDGITDQYISSILMWFAAMSGRHAGRIRLSHRLGGQEALSAKPRRVLIVRRVRTTDELNAIQDAIQRALRSTCRALDINQPIALDGPRARQHFPIAEVAD